MKLDRTPMTVLLLLAVVAAFQFVHYYPKLPETIAVHFGAGGEANGWNPRLTFMITYGIIEAIIILIAIAAAFLIEKTPTSMINLPNRDYWFSKERRQKTIEALSSQVIWFEVVTLAFMIAVAQMIFMVNLRAGPPVLPSDLWVILGAFIAAIVWMSVRLVRRYAVIERDETRTGN